MKKSTAINFKENKFRNQQMGEGRIDPVFCWYDREWLLDDTQGWVPKEVIFNPKEEHSFEAFSLNPQAIEAWENEQYEKDREEELNYAPKMETIQHATPISAWL